MLVFHPVWSKTCHTPKSKSTSLQRVTLGHACRSANSLTRQLDLQWVNGINFLVGWKTGITSGPQDLYQLQRL